MSSFGAMRAFVGAFGKHFLLKQFLIDCNHRFAFFHNSKMLWGQIEIKMPSLSPTMSEGTIVKWLKKEGDPISPGDVLCEIQTDKAVVGLETEEEGVLAKILVPEDTQNVQLGEIIAIITGEGETVKMPDIKISKENNKTQPHPEIVTTKEKKIDPYRLIGPSVKKLLDEYGIKFSDISGTGPQQNLLKGDVLSHIKVNNLKPAPKSVHKLKKAASPKISRKGAHTDIPLKSSEADVARQMMQSKTTIPHGYMSADCNIDSLFEFKEKFQKDGVDVSLNDFIVRSAVSALKKVPKLKSVRQEGQLKIKEAIDLSITDYSEGNSTTKVIKNAESLNIRSISEVSESKNPASSNGLFKISTLGTFGITEFIEVISPTDVAVLTISGIKYCFDEDRLVKKLRATLSFDNYLIGENEAGEFLKTFKKCLENPLSIISLG